MAVSYENLVIAPRAQEATNFKVNQLNKMQNQQPGIATHVQAQNEKKLTTANKTEDRNDTPFKFDAKEKGNNEYHRQEAEKKEKEKEKTKEELKIMLGCSFDITV